MTGLDRIGGLLIDVDGTLLDGERAYAGAPEALDRVRSRGIRVRFTTNTTRRPRSATASALAAAGFCLSKDEILIPASLARRRILDSGKHRASLLVPDTALEDFEGVIRDDATPDWVVVGDLGRDFTFDRLNTAFRHLRAGASLLALQKNRFWLAGEAGFVLDAGAYVAALEYAASVTAEVVGKPARGFFELALREIGLPADRVMVAGDDVENDILGGASAGCLTTLVRTGKFTQESLARSGASPDQILDSIADFLPG